MMQAFPGRRLKSTAILCSSMIVLFVFFHFCFDGAPSIRSISSFSSKLPTLSGEPLVVSHDGNGPSQDVKETLVALVSQKQRPISTLMTVTKISSRAPVPTNLEENHVSQPILSSTFSSTNAEPEATHAISNPLDSSGAIVAAVSLSTNLSWVHELQNPIWTLHRYDHDSPHPPPSTYFPVNKGNEAMMYLSYILNNYDALPTYSIFIHGHRTSWHQEGDIVELVNALRFRALDQEGYTPLRCDWYPSCPAEIRPLDRDAVVWGPGVWRHEVEVEIAEAWAVLFASEELPRTIASQCCAQFAVTRSAILRRPKAEYESMRDWLVNTSLSNDISGRVFEKLWAYIFTKEAVRCPPPGRCACDYFGMCGERKWMVPPEGLRKWDEE
ncbi:uncharacterized protein BDR25DRAFT_77374 [Lindgomyces ingoldianus]|uniref:Uncharacterized protein n=1 Tax=Lindgomyces ingoldianus TaxID=673940 RepID=A0ACB6QHE4_9PLEO|nr:uncharacterized protein BDR25DRAFT_77374 [Lindgomyces ingoldianus]KAF2466305.1 hypothetical protein BDR25DRAFT_77374 [Lindgomyces ingoldianus]